MTNMKIGTRLALGFGIGFVISLVLGTTGIVQIKKIAQADIRMYRNLTAPMAYLTDMVQYFHRARFDQLMLLLEEDEEPLKQAIANIHNLGADIDKNADRFEKAILSDTGKKAFQRFVDTNKQYQAVVEELINVALTGNKAQAHAFAKGKVFDLAQKTQAAIDELVRLQVDGAQSTSEQNTRIAGAAFRMIVTALVIGLLFSVILGVVITRSVSLPLRAGIGVLGRVAEGDLSQEMSPNLRGRKDEAGELARAIQTMMESLRKLLHGVSASVQTLAGASSELSSVSSQSVTSVKATSEKAAMVAAAAEEMSANSVSVASGMEQATTNLTNVASAAEEMTATIGEIAGNSEKARAITAEATQQARRVTALMGELSKAAHSIGKVTETVTTISDQTKLLALNATIEAARAGAAGKGFAVVAHEIKELARQTAEATEDIRTKVDSIQSSTSATVEDLSRIAQVIGQVSEIVNVIASAIEEQSTVTKDIARNVSEAATGVKEANHRVAQISTVSTSVATDIAIVNRAASDISSGSEQVLTSAAGLSRLAADLQEMVRSFQTGTQVETPPDQSGPRKSPQAPDAIQSGIPPRPARLAKREAAPSTFS